MKKLATFAGGCFWCLEAFYDQLPSVIEAVSGYTGGHTINPTYEAVCSGKTGHYEAVQVAFDSDKISYQELVDHFWRQIDPTDSVGQFVDKGQQYQTAIFYHDEEQKAIAQKSKTDLQGKFKESIITQILPLEKFYLAEDYHQDFYLKKTGQYEAYKKGSGREKRLEQIWGKKI